MAESIKVDKNKRSLGQKSYIDNSLYFETGFSDIEQEFTTTSFEVVQDLEFTKLFDSQTVIFLIASFQIWITGSGPGACEISLMIDGVSVKDLQSRFGEEKTSTLYHVQSLSAGSHTLSVKARLTDDFGSQIVHVKDIRLTYIELAKK